MCGRLFLRLQCVDLSCNELSDITLPENLPPKLQELDLTGNPRLNLDHKTLEQLKYAAVSPYFIVVVVVSPARPASVHTSHLISGFLLHIFMINDQVSQRSLLFVN